MPLSHTTLPWESLEHSALSWTLLCHPAPLWTLHCYLAPPQMLLCLPCSAENITISLLNWGHQSFPLLHGQNHCPQCFAEAVHLISGLLIDIGPLSCFVESIAPSLALWFKLVLSLWLGRELFPPTLASQRTSLPPWAPPWLLFLPRASLWPLFHFHAVS